VRLRVLKFAHQVFGAVAGEVLICKKEIKFCLF